MKKLQFFSFAAFFVAALSIFMVACQKDESSTNTGVTTEAQNVELYSSFKFTKDVKLKDDMGNTVTVKVSADKQELVNQHDETSLKLVTTKEMFSKSTSKEESAIKSSNIAQRWQAENANVVDILVTETSFDKSVTGFHIDIQKDDRSWDECQYQYGAQGSSTNVKGHNFTWIKSKKCNSEQIEVELAWVNSCYFCTYNTVSNQLLNNVGDVSTYSGSPQYKWRLRWDFENCNSNDRVDCRTWNFVTQ